MAKHALAFLAFLLLLTVSASLFAVGNAANSLHLIFADPKYKKFNVPTTTARKMFQNPDDSNDSSDDTLYDSSDNSSEFFHCEQEDCRNGSCDYLNANCICETEFDSDNSEETDGAEEGSCLTRPIEPGQCGGDCIDDSCDHLEAECICASEFGFPDDGCVDDIGNPDTVEFDGSGGSDDVDDSGYFEN